MKEVLKILFKHDTQNTKDAPSMAILPCLAEIAEHLRAENIRVELQKYKVVSRIGEKITHANLFAYQPNHKGQHILFQGHIDTVPFGGLYHYSLDEKLIIGRGAVDMKGPLAGAISALKELIHDNSLKYPPALLITGDEEANAFAGIKNFLQTNQHPIAFAINGEPTNLKVATEFRGTSIYDMEMSGYAKHSSSPDNDKLIERTIPLLNAIQRFLDEVRKIKNDILGETIAALTLLNAGVKSNQLPENLRIAFNLRTVTTSERYENLYREMISPHLPQGMKVKYLSFDPVHAKIPETYLTSITAAFKKNGILYDTAPVNAFTEATLMNQSGIPSFDLGPGNMLLAHVRQEDERISIHDVEIYRALLVEIVKQCSL